MCARERIKQRKAKRINVKSLEKDRRAGCSTEEQQITRNTKLVRLRSMKTKWEIYKTDLSILLICNNR
jgi:hypothetical protein